MPKTKAYEANRALRSRIKNTMTSLKKSYLEGTLEETEKLYKQINSLLDKSMARKIHHKNFVRRNKSKAAMIYNKKKKQA